MRRMKRIPLSSDISLEKDGWTLNKAKGRVEKDDCYREVHWTTTRLRVSRRGKNVVIYFSGYSPREYIIKTTRKELSEEFLTPHIEKFLQDDARIAIWEFRLKFKPAKISDVIYLVEVAYLYG